MPARNDQLSVFPVFLKVEGRFAVVVGNGEAALAKARLLKESRVGVRVVAPRPDRSLAAFIIQADLDHVATPFAPAMLDGAAMVFAATGDGATDEAIVAAARRRNILANAVDRPELCDFYTPALVNRAPVAVAIGSEGTGPVLTQIIRSRVEALLPRSTGQLARMAAGYRRVVERLVPRGAARRHFWRTFFEGDVARCVEAGRLAEARRHATRMLKEPGRSGGFVSIVDAGSGETDLMTLRAQRVLQEADVIVHDGAVSADIIGLGRRDARRIAVGDAPSALGSGEAGTVIAALAEEGDRVVRVVAGADAVRGTVETLRESGLAFEIVPAVAADAPGRATRHSHLAA